MKKQNTIITYENLIKQIYNANVFIPLYLSKIMTRIIIYYAHMLCYVLCFMPCVYISHLHLEKHFIAISKNYYITFFMFKHVKGKRHICTVKRIIYESLHRLIAIVELGKRKKRKGSVTEERNFKLALAWSLIVDDEEIISQFFILPLFSSGINVNVAEN